MGGFGLFKHKRQVTTQVASGLQAEVVPGPPESYLIENRRHLKDVPYLLPKDFPEASRLDFQHHFFYEVLGHRHVVAPVRPEQVRRVLDVGSGTGAWLRDVARLFPFAEELVGFDLEPPVLGAHVFPGACRFVQGNLLQGLPTSWSQRFDLVHQRLLVAAIPTVHWPAVIRSLVMVTRPGGWVELVEVCDAYLHAGPALQQFLAWGRQISLLRGMDVSRITELDVLLREAGVHSIAKQVISIPIGSWGGRAGELLAKNTLAAFESFKGLYGHELGIAPAQFDATLRALAAEWDAYHTEFPLYVFYGQA